MAQEKKGEPFLGFVLLREPQWSPRRIATDLLATWGIAYPGDAMGEGTQMVFDWEGATIAFRMTPTPVPEGEAEQNASTNYLWPQGVEAVRRHQAHLMVAVIPGEKSVLDAAKLFSKVACSALNQAGAIGFYTAGTVFEAAAYQEQAMEMRADPNCLPILNWIYLGIYKGESTTFGYTFGLKNFGKEEVEVLESKATSEDLQEFLRSICQYVLAGDITLQNGETIGFTEEQKCSITRSAGVAVDGMTLKIAF